MMNIVIDEVMFAASYGGAVFRGTCENGSRHRFVSRYDVMPRPPIVGEVWKIEGAVQDHAKFGRQIVTKKASLQRPSGRLIISTIARSRAFPGIGEKYADFLWRRFGEDLYSMLDAGDPTPFEEALRSTRLARVLLDGWKELSSLAETYQWLDRHGASVWLANKILTIYQDDIVNKLERNPYRLLAFADWEITDRIAKSTGVGVEDERRLVAAADAAIINRLRKHHTWGTDAEIERTICSIIDCPTSTARRAIELAISENALVRTGDGLQGLGPASMEEYIATVLAAMVKGNFKAVQGSFRQNADEEFLVEFLKDFSSRNSLLLNSEQQMAVKMALNEPVSIICGGAGVGKTTVLNAICGATEKLGGHVYMLALSGRAARRMQEATGREAMTIASFIRRIDQGEIALDSEPTVAIDEASMLDLPLMYRLIRRLEPGCRLLLIGDPGQLPPISFGVVFHVLVETKFVPMIELTQIQRQAAATGIPQVSREIRDGMLPLLMEYKGKGLGIQFIDRTRAEIPNELVKVMTELGGSEEACILTPVKNGIGGTRETNRIFHLSLSSKGVVPECEGFAEGEPVIWMENDYDLGLMNGSLGRIIKANGSIVVDWDGEEKKIENLKNMEHAYSITIHKSQGSQFKRVVVPVFDCRLLDRTMLYTAITRGVEQVVLIGERQAFDQAVTELPNTSIRKNGFAIALKRALRNKANK